MAEIDLTDYVNVAAETWWENQGTGVSWSDVTNVDLREAVLDEMLPLVTVILDTYRKNNEKDNYDFLGGIG